MKIITSLLASSFLALTLVTARGAVNVINSASAVNTTKEKNAFSKALQEENEKPVVLLLHENNNGAKFTIPSGTLVKVIVEENPSTGCSWNWKFSDESSDVLEFQKRKIGCFSPNLIGAPFQERWIFQATNPGETVLTFSYGRSWDKEAFSLKTVQFDITVE